MVYRVSRRAQILDEGEDFKMSVVHFTYRLHTYIFNDAGLSTTSFGISLRIGRAMFDKALNTGGGGNPGGKATGCTLAGTGDFMAEVPPRMPAARNLSNNAAGSAAGAGDGITAGVAVEVAVKGAVGLILGDRIGTAAVCESG